MTITDVTPDPPLCRVHRTAHGPWTQGLLYEWLETNARGDYAASTAAFCATRRYHGLLVARPPGSHVRHLFLSRFEERWQGAGEILETSVARYPDDVLAPAGHELQESFALTPHPCARYRRGALVLERELQLVTGRPAVLLRYRVQGAAGILALRPLLPFRPADDLTVENSVLTGDVSELEGGLSVRPYAALPAIHIKSSEGFSFEHDPLWYRAHAFTLDLERGYEGSEDEFSPGALQVALDDGRYLYLAASIDGPIDDPRALWHATRAARGARVRAARGAHKTAFWTRMSLAADDFLYTTPGENAPDAPGAPPAAAAEGRLGVNAGYPWFGEWGRDTFIALPGLTLARGLVDDCARALSGAMDFLQDGLIPNIFGRGRADSQYGSVDAALWWARAVRLYERGGGSRGRVLDEYLPGLEQIAQAYWGGTELHIRADEGGLIRAGDPEKNSTWMDARTPAGPVTPRHGCAVEINALWYALLSHLERAFAQRRETTKRRLWQTRRRLARRTFLARFWLAGSGYLADVWSEREVDASVRPNMVIAAALEASPLTRQQRAAVVGRARDELLTPRGLRTLSPRHEDYRGHYRGGPDERDGAYHQGTAWPWLLGFFVEAALRAASIRGKLKRELGALLRGFEDELDEHGLNHVSEVFDGDAPHAAGGCFAQAWNTAELLRAQHMLQKGLV